MAEHGPWRARVLTAILFAALISSGTSGKSLFVAFWYEYDEPLEWRQAVDAGQCLLSFAVALLVSKVQARARQRGEPQSRVDSTDS